MCSATLRSSSPHLRLIVRTLAGLFLASMTSTASAQITKVVGWGQTEVTITAAELGLDHLMPLAQTVSVASSHGSLQLDGTDLVYAPSSRFWQIGFDTFQVSVGGKAPRDVFLIANLREEPLAGDAFQGCVLGGDWTWTGDLSELQLQSSSVTNDCFLRVQAGGTGIGVRTRPQALTGPGGGNTSISLDPGIGGGTELPFGLPDGMEVPIVAGVTQDGRVVFELVLTGSQLLARAYRADGSAVTSSPLALSDEAQHLEMDWWFASASGARDGGVMLSRNGVFETAVTGVDNFGLLGLPWSWEFGLLGPTNGGQGVLALLDPEVWVSPRQPMFEPIFADSAAGFSLSRWSDLINPDKIMVSTKNSTQNPQFLLGVSNARQVALVDDSPVAERHFRARFSLGVDQMAPGTGVMTIFAALGQSREKPVFSVQLRFNQNLGAYQVRTRTRHGAGEVVSPWASAPPAVATLEVSVQWWAETQAAAADGGLRLEVGGAELVELGQLTSTTLRVEEAWIGAVLIPKGWQGELLFDDLCAWR